MAPAAPGQDTSGTGIVWGILGLFLLLGLIWYFGHTQVVTAFFWLKHLELKALQFFAGSLGQFRPLTDFIENTSPASTRFPTFASIASQVGVYIRFPMAIILATLSVALFSRNIASKFAQTYSTNTLLKAEANTWPYAKVILHNDVLNADIYEGPWAMAMSPMGFAKKYKLIREHVMKMDEGQLRKDMPIQISLLKAKTTRMFALQVGKPWKGPGVLNDYTKALFAAFLAKAARDSKKSIELLRQYANSMAEGHLNLKGVNEVIEKYKTYPQAVEVMNNHAYVMTVLASLLVLARQDGVISTAEFLWLKPIDRRLWYMLNSVGRQTACVEAAGPFAHWLAERAIGRKLKTPMVDEATRALELALQEILYNPNIPD